MACYHPLKAFKVGLHPSGKPKYKICSYETTYLVKNKIGDWVPCYEPIITDKINPIIRDYVEIPCGKCIGCLLKRSREWADRCMMEASYHEHNSFITLTYNDEHLPEKREIINSLTGEISESPYRSLQKEDFQKFMKRLRKAIHPLKIRYFACGEYGDFENTGRPHYHAIIFGYDFPDKVEFKKNFRNEKYYVSELLQKCWSDVNKNPIGFTTVCDVSWDCCAYVARYCLKKMDNNLSDFYKQFALDPEFTLMSRKPGIARNYYEEHKNDIYEDQRIILSDVKGNKILRPPKYFDKLYDIDNPDDFIDIKSNRMEFMKNKKEIELSKTDLDYIEYLKVKEYNFHKRTAILKERSKYEKT